MTGPQTSLCCIQVPSPVHTDVNAALRVNFQGRSTAGSHHTVITLNDFGISDESWIGSGVYTQCGSASQSLLRDGGNTVAVELPGDLASVDIVYLNWIEIDYWRELKPFSDQLTFRIDSSGPRRVQVTGFSSSDLELYDITEAKVPKRVVNFSVLSDGALKNVIFRDSSSSEKRFWLGTVNAILKPRNLTLWESSGLKSTANGADWIVITKGAFLPALAPLVTLRQSQGLRTKVVAIEDVYNEFNYGVFDPTAIKTFS